MPCDVVVVVFALEVLDGITSVSSC